MSEARPLHGDNVRELTGRSFLSTDDTADVAILVAECSLISHAVMAGPLDEGAHYKWIREKEVTSPISGIKELGSLTGGGLRQSEDTQQCKEDLHDSIKVEPRLSGKVAPRAFIGADNNASVFDTVIQYCCRCLGGLRSWTVSINVVNVFRYHFLLSLSGDGHSPVLIIYIS